MDPVVELRDVPHFGSGSGEVAPNGTVRARSAPRHFRELVLSLDPCSKRIVTMVEPVRSALITTKLSVEVRGSHNVGRERLRALLDTATEARLVLVSAPAGFGKSTLLADWLGQANVRGAWVSLDALDNDIVRFARYLAAAATRLSGRAVDIAAFDARSFDPELALSGILDRVEAAGDGAVLVLDDYHVIYDPAIHRLVASLVERLPSGARVAIATRADPPLPLARLRARGELLEVRAEDLQFSAAEAAALMCSTGVELPQEEVQELTDRTEGWAAALRLAAVSLRGRPDHAERVRRFGASHRYILDYVVEEVLAGLSHESQEFLLRTSILEHLCGPLCDVVTEDRGGQERLEELERANLLIVPLDDERRWYRYHPLFAEILRARLRMLHPGEVAGLHARASAWHEERGDDDEAIRHALLSGDLERTSRIVAIASGGHISAGELSTVRGWLDALPPEVVRIDAQLSTSYAWCLVLAGEMAGVAERLTDADRAFADGHDGGPMMRLAIPAQLALLRSQLAALEGDSATAIAQARLARELVPAELPAKTGATLRGTATVLLAFALARADDLDAAAEAYETALPDLRAGGNRFATGRAIGDLARIAMQRGDPDAALRLCESELQRTPSESAATDSAAVWAVMARARAELGQAELADGAARRALELATRSGDAPCARLAQATLDRVGPLLAGGAGVSCPRPKAGLDVSVEALTAREIEVLRLVALGRSNSQIATQLFVTVGTVKSHVHTISSKLGAANRTEAVSRSRQLGLLD
jgi:LuxR family transcriptional regulator, maltose regulon positive regulatory protein